jgi:hypothetical protein
MWFAGRAFRRVSRRNHHAKGTVMTTVASVNTVIEPVKGRHPRTNSIVTHITMTCNRKTS